MLARQGNSFSKTLLIGLKTLSISLAIYGLCCVYIFETDLNPDATFEIISFAPNKSPDLLFAPALLSNTSTSY
jgi:ABC-type spermidine/putrescine transport system permease subunit II